MSLTLLALLLLGCKGDDKEGGDTASALVAPVLEHTPPSGDLLDGGAVTLTVTATDADGLDNVLLLFRDEGETGFEIQPMEAGALLTFATAGALEIHVTYCLTSSVLPSEKCPSAE